MLHNNKQTSWDRTMLTHICGSYTGWVKKVISWGILPLTVSSLNRFLKILSLLEKVLHVQQLPCNCSHHTLNMLLHYLGQWKGFKFAANLEDEATKCIYFTCAHFNGSCLLTYYLLTYCISLWFPLNILLDNRLFYVNRSKCWQGPSLIGHAMLYEFASRQHIFN